MFVQDGQGNNAGPGYPGGGTTQDEDDGTTSTGSVAGSSSADSELSSNAPDSSASCSVCDPQTCTTVDDQGPSTSSEPDATDTSSTADSTSSSSTSTTSTTTTTTSSTSTTSTSSSSTTTTTTEEPSNPECGKLAFDQAWLKQKLSELTGAVTTTLGGSTVRLGERFTQDGRQRARLWLKEQYEDLGFQVSTQGFSSGENFIASKPGAGDEVFILSSHFDTVRGTVGADDDGSGVIAGLAVARSLAPCALDRTFRIVAFDQEEQGFDGSRSYADFLDNAGSLDRVSGVLQVEMVGYDSNDDGLYTLVDCDKSDNRFMVNALANASSRNGLGLSARTNCSRRSDQVSFWDKNVPAITISELFFGDDKDPNPCYHQGCDTVGNINFEYMEKMTKLMTYSTIEFVGAK